MRDQPVVAKRKLVLFYPGCSFSRQITSYTIPPVLIAYFVAGAVIVWLLLSVYKKSALGTPFNKLSRGAQNAELVKVLLNLEEKPLDDLFRLYREQFGGGAARYA